MIYPPIYQATDQENQFQVVSETINFSNKNDVIDIKNETNYPVGKHALLHGGDDQYYGTDFDSPDWDNIANGNQGNDVLEGWLSSRDYLRGGKDNDRLWGAEEGNDMLFGDFGDDIVQGSKWGNNIIRGGKGNDTLIGGNNRDLLIGDYGKDEMRGGTGSDLFMLRTDSSSVHFGSDSEYNYNDSNGGFNNLTPEAMEADRILDFQTNDYLVITGVNSKWDVSFTWHNNGDYLVEIETIFGPQYAGIIEAPGFRPSHEQLIINDIANDLLGAADGNAVAFTNNPNLLNSFGI